MSTMFSPREIPAHWTVADLISTSNLGKIPFSELKEQLGQGAFPDTKLVREVLKHHHARECGGRRKAIESDGEALHALFALRDYFWEADHLMNATLTIAVNFVIDVFRAEGKEPELVSSVKEVVYALSPFLESADIREIIRPAANVLGDHFEAKPREITTVPLPDGVDPCSENEFIENFRERLVETMLAIPGFNPQPGEAAKQLNALMAYLDAYIVLCMYEIDFCPAGRGLGVTMDPVKDVARSISFNFYEFMYGMYGEAVYEDDFLPW